ncbi:SDR family oxidoreductase [Telluribacter humicola]|uniref:SDR family oxidoreductase n=1 Tax=Telluribacter humicola TaxID=1720261 RepID=UPI001A9725B1|nr:SDR family oxidoreductase [Telluribacter humicola]
MNKTILITGASRGIGAATAIQAAALGYQVGVNYLKNEEAANQVVDYIVRNGGKAKAFGANVSSEREVDELFKAIDSTLGTVSALVNNAGILETQMPVVDIDVERLCRIFNSNVISCFLCSKEAVKRMSTKRGGSGGAIVNVSSIAARTGAPGEYVDYASSKAAVDALTLGLAKEVADEGIRVNGVRPAFIYTDIHTSGGEPGRVDRIKDSIPMKRGGRPEEVAKAILWLLSDEASYTTGAFLDITGGR